MRLMLVTPDEGTGPWEGIMAGVARDMVRAFTGLGITVSPLSCGVMRADPKSGLKQLADFGPDLITAPNFNYLLLASLGNDLLQVPVPILAPWDDPLGALMNYCTYPQTEGAWTPWPTGPWARVQQLFRRAPAFAPPPPFAHATRSPSVLHVAWDTGHMEAFRALGLDRCQPVHWEPLVVRGQFLDHGRRARPDEPVYDVGFCGNIYQSSMKQHALWQDDFTRALALRAADAKVRDPQKSCWELLLAEVADLPRGVRAERGLTTEYRPFWELYLFLAWTVFNSEVRLRILSGIRRDVNVFGMFADPASVDEFRARPHLRFAGTVDHGTELPRTYSSIKVNVCVSNGLVYRGTPSKLLDCLASGGFALCDPKPDLVRLFGPAAEKIFFRNTEELNEKIEYYLDRPGERAELVRYFQSVIWERCTMEGYFGRILPLLPRLARAA